MGNMPFARKKAQTDQLGQILRVPVDRIRPNPNQPRTTFDPKALEELADSIRVHGILQPLTVRPLSNGSYELISGERRLRASMQLGLTHVPCILREADELESSLLALIENLQRRDLDFVDEALALEQLITTYGLSQEETARRIGKSQSAVANKLRILKLSPTILERLRKNGLTERHGRALLRIPPHYREQVLDAVIEQHLTVSKTEELVELLLQPPAPAPEPEPPAPEEPAAGEKKPVPQKQSKKRPVLLVRDIRLFLNTIDHSMDVMKRSGIAASCGKEEDESTIVLTITIPKVTAAKG